WDFEEDIIYIGARRGVDIALSDPTVSRRHAQIVRTSGSVVLRDLDSTNGTFVGPVRIREVYLTPNLRFRVGRTEMIFTQEDQVINISPTKEAAFEGMVGASVAMRQLFGVLRRIAPTNLTVLLTGETGTGKELASRAVHDHSRRRDGPFIVFDCGAAPENLIESELFGHKRGAFTGAVGDRPGVFELADGGTIFLDEVGELPLELQPKLLRVLEQREVRRVGGTRTKSIDVRVVAATNRNLRDEVAQGTFREDLYYRLAVVEVLIPPLRERMSDLQLLIAHLLQHADHNPGVFRVSEEVMSIFSSYHWPGNVRELNNCLIRALPFCDTDQITLDTLPRTLRSQEAAPSAPSTPSPTTTPLHTDPSLPFKDAKDQLIEAFERQYLVDLLEHHSGNVSRAARIAQMDRKTITRLMKKHQLKRPS
ncbi:MAG: transcriptional regulator with GAF, ATPase, and Fis domain, partial [Myxococcota bacterium]